MSGDITISDAVLGQARKLGMYGNVRRRLTKMANQAAPFTHELANCRFEGYLLLMEGNVLKMIMKRPVKRKLAPGEGPVHRKREEVDSSLVVCPDCDNDGGACASCNDVGKVTKKVADELLALDKVHIN